MACTALSPVTTTPPRSDGGRLPRSLSGMDLQRHRAKLRRSYSDNHICYSVSSPKLKNNGSFVNIPNTLDFDESENEMEGEPKRRANWMERLLELRNNWRGKQDHSERVKDGEEEDEFVDEGFCGDCCQVEDEEDDDNIIMDRETFSSLLTPVSRSDAKLFSQLAFLCNMAYVIPDMKTGDLRRYYGLEFVTSSLEKKAEAAAAVNDKVEQDSTIITTAAVSQKKTLIRSSAAYGIAATAASYVHSRASMGSDHAVNQVTEEERAYTTERAAACAAASTMTAVVAAREDQKARAAKDLQTLHSSPCEWFICDDSSIYTRCFVIQGSDSLASWQANLLFEPTKFEGTDVPVHRGIYEAAKGIYEQFMPEIKQHLDRFGDRAKLQFTGHSLGGSLALLVNLMLLSRKAVKPSALLPVVTFGSPFVFCGGQSILDELNLLEENHVHCVMMHRDIVPRAFSCNYPYYAAQVLKRLNASFRSHPCLNNKKLLYSPMGKLFILQPDEKLSPSHPLLPPGSALYTLQSSRSSLTRRAVQAFLNSPHPLETLSDPTAYGSEGTIIRDHDSSNYLKAAIEVIRKHTRMVVRKPRKQRNQMWPLLTTRSPHSWSHPCDMEGRLQVNKEALTGV